jgi:hypothetical protein
METTRRSYARPVADVVADAVTGTAGVEPHVLLVGPHDPEFGGDACLAPPLGVWRIAGVLGAAGVHVQVFDPNCCDEAAGDAFTKILTSRTWRLIAFSITAATLRFDLGLAHLARRLCGDALIAVGGTELVGRSEAVFAFETLDTESLFRAGAFDVIVFGPGERPLLELVDRLRKSASTRDVPGTASIDASGQGRIHRFAQPALDRRSFRDTTFGTPYAQMPFRHYWDKLTDAYKLHDLPVKAERDARLAEVRAIHLDTLGGPIGTGCACSPANVIRLDADECVSMVGRIVSAWPDVRTIVFQDDVFVFTSDQRIRPLCEGLLTARRAGDIPPDLEFISTNRIDSMDESRLALMKRAGFRILNFRVESFAPGMLAEFGRGHVHECIAPNLQAALKLGITPFLDLLLTSPRCGIKDVAFNVTTAFKWLQNGCEARMQPYVVPFSGAILPIDPVVREAVVEIERMFTERLTTIEAEVARLPARVRSLLWIACAIRVLTPTGEPLPSLNAAVRALVSRLPVPSARASKLAHNFLPER